MAAPRVALYARYSSDLQRNESIEDQLHLCREHAARQGWTVVDSYYDRAISGASMLRLGLQELMADASRGGFDMVLTEALDRLSRSQADIAHIYSNLYIVTLTSPGSGSSPWQKGKSMKCISA